ncbi:MAG: hypothetical protein CSB47_00745 [Proteobacteria bacterium]|nr:MAG: hypothetical protein CSB47_00745 [Pseudomonadota bacterium]
MNQHQTFYRHPDLPFLELRCGYDTTACYALHTHAEYSLGAVLRGYSRYQYQQRHFRLSRGDSVFVPANIAHACNLDDANTANSWQYLMLYIHADYWQQLCADWQVKMLFDGKPINSPELFRLLIQLHQTWAMQPDEAAVIEAAWLKCFSQLIKVGYSVRQKDCNDKPCTPLVDDILSWLDHCTSEPLSLARLAQVTGYQRHQILRKFQQELGISPYQYLLNKRIQHAKKLLKSGHPLSEVTYQLGFSDQAHFQHTFKRYTAITPRQYQIQTTTIKTISTTN